jgi:hypothetical protein
VSPYDLEGGLGGRRLTCVDQLTEVDRERDRRSPHSLQRAVIVSATVRKLGELPAEVFNGLAEPAEGQQRVGRRLGLGAE